MKRIFLALALGLWVLPGAEAQLRVQLASERNTFLLYEPIYYNVRLTNDGGMPIAFRDDESGLNPWLSFLIFDSSQKKVRRVQGVKMKDLLLQAGETKVLRVNLTQGYRLRSTGQYDVQASVRIPGGETQLTSALRFHIGQGQEIWSDIKVYDGVERKYSLLRFIDGPSLFMYARVEEESERLVYSTRRLGTIVGYTEPQAQFDERGHFHVLHIQDARVHRHTEMDRTGQILKQEDFQQYQDYAPQFTADGNGGFKITGAVSLTNRPERPKLSGDQQGL